MRKDIFRREIARFLDAWLGARQLIQAANFNRFQKAGLSATQFMTLNLLPGNELTPGEMGMTLSELARRMNLGMATVARTVDSLEMRGMLTRTKSESDRRMTYIALTGEGKELQNAASREFHEHMAALFRAMDATKRTGLIEGLEALIKASTSTASAEGGGATRESGDDLRAKRSSPRSRRR